MTKQELSRRERRKLEDQKSIVKAATELFSKKGYNNVAMSEIAAKADFAVGTLYKYFNTKEDLYDAIFLELVDQVLSQSLIVLSQDKDVLTLLKEHLELGAKALLEHQELIRLYFVEVHNLVSHSQACCELDIRGLKTQIMEKERQVMERGVSEGVFRNISPSALQIAFSGLFESFMLAWINDPDQYPDGIDTQQIIEIFLQGTSTTGNSHEV